MSVEIHQNGKKLGPVTDVFGSSPWVVVSPHDDDAILGCGLLMSCAKSLHIDVYVIIVTNGAMGYYEEKDKVDLVSIRKKEVQHAFVSKFGLPEDRVIYFDVPDGQVLYHMGCSKSHDADPHIGQLLVSELRRIRPGAVFSPTYTDLHHDHRFVALDVSLAICWATSKIWLQRGEPIPAPKQFSYAVYCDFPDHENTFLLQASLDHLQCKVDALRCFASQPFIEPMLARIMAAGPYEAFKEITWQPFDIQQFSAHHLGCMKGFQCSEGLAHDMDVLSKCLSAFQSFTSLHTLMSKAPILIVAEGSSRMFPGSVCHSFAYQLGMSSHIPIVMNGRAASAYPAACHRLYISNSGSTRELVEDYQASHTTALSSLALLGVPNGKLTTLIDKENTLVLLCEPEVCVAATASTYLQGLALCAGVLQSVGKDLPLTTLIESVDKVRKMTVQVPPALLHAKTIWWVSAHGGLVEEAALKTAEFIGIRGQGLKGSDIVHGYEEVMGPSDVVVVLDADPRDMDLLRKGISGAGAHVVEHLLPCEVTQGPSLFYPFFALTYVWRVLDAIGQFHGRDPRYPLRARKVGNPLV